VLFALHSFLKTETASRPPAKKGAKGKRRTPGSEKGNLEEMSVFELKGEVINGGRRGLAKARGSETFLREGMRTAMGVVRASRIRRVIVGGEHCALKRTGQ